MDEQQQKEVFYVLTRLIRGLGSPKTQVRTVYYSVLVVIVSRLLDKSWFNLDSFKDIVDKELTKYDSKAVSIALLMFFQYLKQVLIVNYGKYVTYHCKFNFIGRG